MMQGAVTIALLLFVFTSVLGQPLNPWSIQRSGVTPTPRQLVEMHVAAGTPEDLLSAAHSFKLRQARAHRERGKALDRGGNPETARLSRVKDVATLGFVPVTGPGRRVLTNPAEDVLISQVSNDFLAEIHAKRQSAVNGASRTQAPGFRFGVIPVAYWLD